MTKQAAVKALCASVRESATLIRTLESEAERIADIGAELVKILRRGGKLLTAGNGGSAAEALHMSEELIGRFLANRRALPAVSLVADPTAMTCIGNDFGFDEIFSRQVQGLGNEGDMLAVFSTSGNARNLRRAVEAAREKNMRVVCLLGRDGGPMAGLGDHQIIVRGDQTARIQEAHQVIVHLLLELVEDAFPPENNE